jgi:hypothetical protein
MTERPIIFSAEMVREILSCRKTQTRRVAPIRELNILQRPGDMITWSVSFLKAIKGTLSSHSGGKFSDLQARSIIASQFNPYGKPGDTLWVRETWADLTETHGTRWEKRDPETGLYKRGVEPFVWHRADGDQPDIGDGKPMSEPWRPSIYMPRWASRITLEVKGIRVERLHDITEDDARAEGCDPVVHPDGAVDCGTRKTTFARLWNDINGPGAWEANPWVWVISFERVTP